MVVDTCGIAALLPLPLPCCSTAPGGRLGLNIPALPLLHTIDKRFAPTGRPAFLANLRGLQVISTHWPQASLAGEILAFDQFIVATRIGTARRLGVALVANPAARGLATAGAARPIVGHRGVRQAKPLTTRIAQTTLVKIGDMLDAANATGKAHNPHRRVAIRMLVVFLESATQQEAISKCLLRNMSRLQMIIA